MRVLAAILVSLVLAACTMTQTKLAANTAGVKPAAGTSVLVVEPDIQLALLTAVGMEQPRADWSEQAQENMGKQVQAALQSRTHKFVMLDPDEAMEGRVGQLLRLHEAVGNSIQAFNFGVYSLPTKKTGFDWTLGEGARALGEAYGADYALFVHGRGTYSSGGRKALAIGAAILGAHVALGKQQTFASLVDLKTGQVVWFNVAQAGPNADMREPEGAKALVTSVLKDVPL